MGRNSNSLVVCDGISYVLIAVHGVFAKKYENIKWNIKAIKIVEMVCAEILINRMPMIKEGCE